MDLRNAPLLTVHICLIAAGLFAAIGCQTRKPAPEPSLVGADFDLRTPSGAKLPDTGVSAFIRDSQGKQIADAGPLLNSHQPSSQTTLAMKVYPNALKSKVDGGLLGVSISPQSDAGLEFQGNISLKYSDGSVVRHTIPNTALSRKDNFVTFPVEASNQTANHATVSVFYATDRKPSGDTVPETFYTGVRFNPRTGEDSLLYGVAEVSIPRDHRIGEIERPSLWRLEYREDPNKHVVILGVTPQKADDFFQKLSGGVSASETHDLLVFIHGYNTTFADALRRTAQIFYDLDFDGAPILYSWPSAGEVSKYPVDETNVEWTTPHLLAFLTLVIQRSHPQNVYLLAHSMGNRALIRALESLRPKEHAIREVLMAAPDIDSDVFRQEAPPISNVAARLTLYASSKDEALELSKKFHGYPRAGDPSGGIVIVPGIDTIDATAVDTGLTGHSYYGDNRSVITDIHALIAKDTPPSQRFGLSQRAIPPNLIYWIFRP
jgi:esterase/lipase superfamily enzyme